MPVQYCKRIDIKPKKKLDYKLSESCNLDIEYKDFSWILACLDLDKSGRNRLPGTWGAFNSLVSTKETTKTSVVTVPPLIRAPPTDINVLYTSFMNIQNIANNITGKDCLTVITLDMQLYDMAMKLWCSVEDVSNSFLFRPGELHILMWALACIGDYIEGSGIDQAWIEAGMYSATTAIKQVLKGKHLYRSLDCHFITTISMYNLYFQQFLKKFPNEHQLIVELSNTLKDGYENDVNSETPGNLVKIINEDAVWFDRVVGVASKIAIYKKDMNPIQTFLFNYIKQFETTLLFIRAT